MGFTRPSRPSAATLGDTPSALTRRLIADGLKPRTGKLTDVQALIERLECAARPGGSTNAHRRKLLIEAAQFIREHRHVAAARSSEAA